MDAKQQPARNSVALSKDGVILQHYRGHQTAKAIERLGEQTDELIEQQQERGERILLLVDVSELGTFGESEVAAWRHRLATRAHDKVAIVHLNPALRVVLHFVVKATNQGDRVEVFEDTASALAWLKE